MKWANCCAFLGRDSIDEFPRAMTEIYKMDERLRAHGRLDSQPYRHVNCHPLPTRRTMTQAAGAAS